MTFARRIAAAAATAILACPFAASADQVTAASRAAAGPSGPVAVQSASKRSSHRKSSSTRRAECAAAARTEKARKACAIKKAKARAKKPSVSGGPLEPSLSPAFASPGVQEPAQEPVGEEDSPAEGSEPTDPEGGGATPGPPGGSGSPPVETSPTKTPPVETPAEETPPVETPPVETPAEETPPAETPPETPLVETPLTGPVEPPLVETSSAGKSSTTTTLVSSANPSTVGQAVTYTAAVGPAAATGAITFKEGGVAIPGCTKQTVASGTATTCTTTYSRAGWHSIIAVYSGDNSHATSTSPTLTQVIHGDPTTVTVASSLNPSTVGQNVTYTATVNPASATGTVEFTTSGSPISGCAAKVVSSGSAKCTTTFSAAGGPWIRAVYSGDNTYATSTSANLTQTINKDATITALVSSANPSIVGQTVTYTATVSPAAATGAITFKEDGVAIPGCTKKTIAPGTATTCTTTYSTVGWHSIIAVYSGDNTYSTSTSPTLTQVIHGDPTTVTLSSSLNPSTVGQAVTYTATVNPATATGAVAFREAGTAVAGCSAQTIDSGKAKCSVADYANWGSYNITASYGGDSHYLGSTSSTSTQTVEPPPVGPAPFRFFSPTSFWNEALPTNASLDPNSAATMDPFVEKIVKEEEAGKLRLPSTRPRGLCRSTRCPPIRLRSR